MNWNYIFNPIAKFPDKALMLVGVLSFAFGSFVSWRYQMIYDGILDAHSFPTISYITAFLSNAINIIIMCVGLFAIGKVINPKTRMIDILNTSFLYRIPIYIMAILSGLPIQKEFEAKLMENISHLQDLNLTTNEMIFVFIFSIFALVMLAYSIVIIVNGFRTATNAKKAIHFLSLAIFIIVAEVLSKIVVNAIV